MSAHEKKTTSEVKPLKVAFQTLGCRSNYADTVELEASILEKGGRPVSFENKEADVYVLNTCTVTDSADKTSLRILRKLKKDNPSAKVVVTGCFAEVGADELSKLSDAVVGPGQRKEVLDAILSNDSGLQNSSKLKERKPLGDSLPSSYPNGTRVKSASPKFKSISLDNEFPSALTGPGEFLGDIANRARFHLRVQEGCENSCTFCIIPTTRGRLSSRSIKDLLLDLGRLRDLGYEEVVLTGTHLGGYGVDIGSSLKELLEKILSKHEQGASFPRIRLSSIDPNDVDTSILELLFNNPSIFCRHLHLCFQAFSSRILKRMNRLYTLEEALEKVYFLEENFPDCAIGSDVICGFPGESLDDFQEQVKLFEKRKFSYLHVFPYSERQGTAALNLKGSMEYKERKRRAARWRALSFEKHLQFFSSKLHKRLEIIVEKSNPGFISGTSSEFISCRVEGAEEKLSKDIQIGARLDITAKRIDRVKGELVCEL